MRNLKSANGFVCEEFANEWKELEADLARREEAGGRDASTRFKSIRFLEEQAANKGTNVTSKSGSRPTASDQAKWDKTSMRRQRSIPEVRIDEEEDDDDDEVKMIKAPTPANPSRIVHDPSCEPCGKRDIQCTGAPNRRCDPCAKARRKCDKSRGRGRKGKETKSIVPDLKGKIPVPRPFGRRVNPARQAKASSLNAGPSAMPSVLKGTSPLLEDEDDEMPTKKAKSARPSGPTPKMLADARRAILSAEAKSYSTLAFLRDLEARVSDMDAVVAAQQGELARVKAVLEMML